MNNLPNTQRAKVLALLQTAGSSGINSYDLTYKYAVKQAPTRIKELKEQGHYIFTKRNKNRSVSYILIKKDNATILREKPGTSYHFVDGVAYPLSSLQPEQLAMDLGDFKGDRAA